MTGEPFLEEVVFSLSLLVIALPVLTILLAALVYDIKAIPIGFTRIDANWIVFPILTALIILTVNFGKLETTYYRNDKITASFGWFEAEIPLANITNCYLDETLPLRYFGDGIRVATVNGSKRLVYSVLTTPRLVLKLQDHPYDEFVFSSTDPLSLCSVIQKDIKAPPI